ncbi:MAG: hypothetical protein KKC46_20245, partial [Proteobacteria bacterium]|nr:hypothetical protein [Pseudomonadota bacterium]
MKAELRLTIKWLLVVTILFLSVMEVKAEVMLSDTLSVTGYLRQELAVHTGKINPNNKLLNQKDNNSLNLSRTFFQTEWTYLPNDIFKLYSKVKLISDQTQAIDDDLLDYNAFPLGTPRYGTYLRATNDNEFNAEMSELYADVSLGNLWLRLGKQQIVWGEMISARILDVINPLDWSWHFQFEPEEFENIRVPQWAARARYDFAQGTGALQWIGDVYCEGFLNPGDISPTIYPAPGSPFNLKPETPSVFTVREEDRRGNTEYGIRIGGRVGQFAGTLNYLSLYSDSGFLERTGGGPAPPFIVTTKYPKTELYGASLNYSFPSPIDTTVTYEGVYSPDEPYYDAASPVTVPCIRYNKTLKHAIRFDRKTFILPSPISAMMIQFQYSQTLISNNDKIKSTPSAFSKNNNIDSSQNVIALILSQDLWHNDVKLSLTALYDLDGCSMFRPGFKYIYGNHWIFDIYGVIL